MAALLRPIPDPIAVDALAGRIRAQGNIRFAWQSFRVEAGEIGTAAGARAILSEVIAEEARHSFLRETFASYCDEPWWMAELHAHCPMTRDDAALASTLTDAADGILGAYAWGGAKTPHATTAALFSAIGPHQAFWLTAGKDPSCETCRSWGHPWFSSWFHGVAWDWCVVVTWPDAGVAWVGCLTDTD